MLLVLALVLLAVAVVVAGEVMTLPVRERSGSVRRASTYGERRNGAQRSVEPFRDRAIFPLKEKVARTVYCA